MRQAPDDLKTRTRQRRAKHTAGEAVSDAARNCSRSKTGADEYGTVQRAIVKRHAGMNALVALGLLAYAFSGSVLRIKAVDFRRM